MTGFSIARSLTAVPRRVVGSSRKQFSSLMALDVEYDGLPSLSPQPAKASTISITTLPSGLIVATDDACSTTSVTMTYPKAGSGAEQLGEQGAALTNKCLNFMSGTGVSTIMINRTIEDAGGVPTSTVDRYGSMLGFTVAPEKAMQLIPFLSTNCSFEKWDVRDAKKQAKVESDASAESAQIVLTENLYAAAYGAQSPMGRPLFGVTPSLDAIMEFRGRSYGLKGAVLAATGIKDHKSFCNELSDMIPASDGDAGDKLPAPAYMGGESRVSAPGSGYAHVALAFPCTASPVVASVVTAFLNLAGKASGVSAFTVPGMVGIYAGSDSAGSLTDTLCGVAKTAASPDLVKRAKNIAKADALFALDGGSKSLAACITASVLDGSLFSGAADVSKAYDAVKDKDVADALAAMCKSNPSLAAVGDISSLPYQATFAANLK